MKEYYGFVQLLPAQYLPSNGECKSRNCFLCLSI